MSKILWYRVVTGVSLVLLWSAPLWGQASLTNSGFTENFDSMGSTGTSPPSGWNVYSLAGSNTTFQASIPASSISGGTLVSPLTAMLNPSANNNNGYNAATSAAPNDRSLATAPTGNAASVLELQLRNNTGSALTALAASYDIRRFTVGASGADELPGYWLFYSLDGGTTFTNVTGDTIFVLADPQNPSDPTDNGVRAPLNAIQIVAN